MSPIPVVLSVCYRANENGTLRVPIAPWSQQSSVPHEKRSGTVTVSTFELRATSITPAQVAAPIRQALRDAEFQITLDCMSNECGGFDYRVNTPIVSPPNMYVNLRDFLSMTGTKGSDQIINILISGLESGSISKNAVLTPQQTRL